MILGLQITSLVFAVFMIYIALINYKKKQINKIEFYIWLLIWLFTIFVIFNPERLQNFAQLYFARTFDMMVAGAFIVVLYMVTFSYLSVRRMEKKMEDLVRKEALNKVKKNKDK